MEKLWSPWRSHYIESFNKGKKDKECIFCLAKDKKVSGKNNLLVEKGDYTFTLLNLYPYNNGHLMIVPYRHISDFSELTKTERTEVMDKIDLALNAIKLVSNPEGFNVGLNLGKASGAGIDAHLHFHVVPRWTGDTNFMPVLGEVKIISQDLLVTKQNLVKAFNKLKKS